MYLVFLCLALVWALVFGFIMLSMFAGFLRTRVPFVVSSSKDIIEILKSEGVSNGDVFVDLGSGDGRIVTAVAKVFLCKAVGYELTLWTYIVGRINAWIQRVQVTFLKEDFFNADLSSYTVVYGYLYPPLMRRLEEKVYRECKPGTLVVLRDFYFPTKVPVRKIDLEGKHDLFIYRV